MMMKTFAQVVEKSMSPITLLLGTTLTWTIKLHKRQKFIMFQTTKPLYFIVYIQNTKENNAGWGKETQRYLGVLERMINSGINEK